MKQMVLVCFGFLSAIFMPATGNATISVGDVKCMALVAYLSASDVLVMELRFALDGYLDGIIATGIDDKRFRAAFVDACARQPDLSISSATGAALQKVRQ